MVRKRTLVAKSRNQARQHLRERFAAGRTDIEVLHDMERAGFAWIPSRSAFYSLRAEWQAARERDTSGTWSLAADETGHAAVVMKVLAAIVGRTEGRRASVSVAEAGWIARVANALPVLLNDPWQLYIHAVRYLDIQHDGDQDAMASEDALNAVLYADTEDYFARFLGETPELGASPLGDAPDGRHGPKVGTYVDPLPEGT